MKEKSQIVWRAHLKRECSQQRDVGEDCIRATPASGWKEKEEQSTSMMSVDGEERDLNGAGCRCAKCARASSGVATSVRL